MTQSGAYHSLIKEFSYYLIFSRQSLNYYTILFRSVPLSIVTHTGIYTQRNGTEQKYLYYEIMQSTENRLVGCATAVSEGDILCMKRTHLSSLLSPRSSLTGKLYHISSIFLSTNMKYAPLKHR